MYLCILCRCESDEWNRITFQHNSGYKLVQKQNWDWVIVNKKIILYVAYGMPNQILPPTEQWISKDQSYDPPPILKFNNKDNVSIEINKKLKLYEEITNENEKNKNTIANMPYFIHADNLEKIYEYVELNSSNLDTSYLIDERTGYSLLQLACVEGHIDILRYLLTLSSSNIDYKCLYV